MKRAFSRLAVFGSILSIFGCHGDAPAAAQTPSGTVVSHDGTKPSGAGRASFSMSSVQAGPGKVEFGSKAK